VFASKDLVNVSILTKCNDGTDKKQVEVVTHNLDKVTAEDAGASTHSWWVGDDITMRKEFKSQS